MGFKAFLLCLSVVQTTHAASFNEAFASSVVARVETLLDEPFTRALDPLAAAFNSRWSYVYNGEDVTDNLRNNELMKYIFDNQTISLLWTLMKPTDLTGLAGFDFIYVGFENGKNFGYRNLEGQVVLYYIYDGNASCPLNDLEIRCRKVYHNATDQTSGKITGTPSMYEYYDPRIRPWYIASQQGRFYADPYLFNEDNNLGITAVRQIISATDQFLGVFGVDYDLLTIDAALNEVAFEYIGDDAGDYAVFIVETDGLLISTSVPGASVTTINGTATQVHASNSSNDIIAGISRLITKDKALGGGGGWIAANGTVLIVEIEGKGRYWAQAQKAKNGYGLNWFVVVAEPVKCDVGYYVPINNLEEDCKKCPEGAHCLGGSYLPFPTVGYWVDRSSYSFGSKFYQCEFDTCPGYNYKKEVNQLTSDTLECWTELDFNHSKCHEDELVCDEGSIGPLCGTCADGYHYESGERKCVSCGNGNLLIKVIVFWIIVFICFILIGFVILLSKREDVQSSELMIKVKNTWKQILTLPPMNFLKHFDRGMGKVIWVTLQILSTISWNLSLEFPDPFDSFFISRLHYFQLDFIPMKCFVRGDNFITRVCVLSVSPIILLCLNFMIYLSRKWHLEGLGTTFSLRLSEHGTSMGSQITSQHAYFALLLSYLVLPICSLVQFSALNCVTLKEGSSYLRADTSVDCNSSEYQTFLILDAILILIYQTVPMIWFWLLWNVRDKLNPNYSEEMHNNNEYMTSHHSFSNHKHKHHSSSSTLSSLSSSNTQIREDDYSIKYLSFLWQDYKPSKWYFEVCEMYRRTLFVAVIPLIGKEGVLRAVYGTLFSMIMVAYLSEAIPFIKSATNSLLVIAQYQILFTFFVAVLITADALSDLHFSNFMLGLVLIGVNLILIFVVFWCCFQRYLKERKEKKWKKTLSAEQLFIFTEFMKTSQMDGNDFFEFSHNVISQRSGSHLSHPLHKSLELTDHNKIYQKKTPDMVMQRYLLQAHEVVLEEKIGSGAFGQVFKGTCYRQTVAVKTLIDITEQSLQMFRTEIITTASLRHPNIVNFIGACWGRELICLMVEWMENGTLYEFILEKNAPKSGIHWNQPLLRMVTDIARGMNYLHHFVHINEMEAQEYSGFIHRDLSPSNCLIGQFACVKVSDFGTTHPINDNSHNNNTTIGTLFYSAPELMLEESNNMLINEKVDVYSFGMILASLAIDYNLIDFLKHQFKKHHSSSSSSSSSSLKIEKLTKEIYHKKWNVFNINEEEKLGFPSCSKEVFQLISKCCNYDPFQRPNFIEIMNELNTKCQEEIENKIHDWNNQANPLHHPPPPPQSPSLVYDSTTSSSSNPPSPSSPMNVDETAVSKLLARRKSNLKVNHPSDVPAIKKRVSYQGDQQDADQQEPHTNP